jgi:uncharacterized protein YxjI
MAETLGMLCDKLTIVKLKEYHSTDITRLESLTKQATQLQVEIDEYFINALNGNIPLDKLTFASNKVFKKDGNETLEVKGNIGGLFYQLADINCKLWHEVEKGYDVANIPNGEKDKLINSLAVMNLQRNKCIDAIDLKLLSIVSSSSSQISQ